MPTIGDNTALSQGRDLHRSGAFTQAETIYREFLSAHPDNVDALHLLGALFQQTSRTIEGLELIQKALSFAEDRWDIRLNYGVILSQAGHFERGAEELEKAYNANPNNEAAFKNLIGILRVLKRYDRAIDLLQNRDDLWALEQLQQIYGLANRTDKSIEVARRVLKDNPDDQLTAHNLHRALIVSSQKPSVTDIFPRRDGVDIGQHIIVAGMRKSASTFVSKMISQITGFDELPLASGFSYTYDFIDREILEYAFEKNTVSHTHCPAHEENILVIQAIGAKPVVVVRNIFDDARSYLDWILGTNYPYETVYKEFRKIPEDEHLSFLIDTFIVRQLEFYSSWQYLERAEKLDIFWASYEDMAQDKIAYFESILSFLNLPNSPQAVKEAVKITEAIPNHRMNKGITGRGAELFSDKNKARVKALTRYYPSVDFSRIGL